MSQILEALKQIQAKRSRPLLSGCPRITGGAGVSPAQATETVAAQNSEVIPEHLLEEPISSPPIVQSAAFDSSTIAKTPARAESAAASALSPREPDIYEDMAQYILVQLTPGQSAALLFTSPGEGTEKSETLFSLSKTLVDLCRKEVLVLDALPDKSEMQNEKMSYSSGDWDHLLEKLKTRYQLVLIDAPSLANAQTAQIIPQCDGVYLMIRLGYTTPYEVCEAVRVIEQAGGRLLGCIAIIAPGESLGW